MNLRLSGRKSRRDLKFVVIFPDARWVYPFLGENCKVLAINK